MSPHRAGRLGRASEALRSDELLAASVGIEATTLRRANMALSGLLGGFAGGLNVLTFGTVNPFDAGFPLIVATLTAVIVGGQRSWVGALIGAALVTSLPSFLSSVSGATRDITFGLLVLFLATFMPDGIFGALSAGWRFARSRLRTGTARERRLRRRLADVQS